jgi:hypothetical protein
LADPATLGTRIASAEANTQLILVVALLGAGVIAASVFMQLGLGPCSAISQPES